MIGGIFFPLAPPSSCTATRASGPPRGKGSLAGLSKSALRTRESECVSVRVHAHTRARLPLGSLGRTGVLGDKRGKLSPLSLVPDTPDCALTRPTQPAAFSREAVVHSLCSFSLQDQARKLKQNEDFF